MRPSNQGRQAGFCGGARVRWRWPGGGLRALIVGAALTAGGVVVAAPPGLGGGRPDPRAMSGLSRLDPEVAPGTVTVRCLLGGFDAPAVGAEVTLEVTAPGQAESTSLRAVTDGQGRAIFRGLEASVGGQAIASVDLEGELARSQPIPLAASAGSRVMLVKGAAAATTATAPATNPGEAAADAGPRRSMPEPGKPFTDRRFPKGTLVVGALDLAARSGIPGVAVRLEIAPPEGPGGGETMIREGITDAEGRALFDGLDGEDVPPGSMLTVETKLAADGPVERSETFAIAEEGQVLVFTRGEIAADVADAAGPVRRRPVMPPRLVPTVPAGAVRVSVIDGADQPVAQEVVAIEKLDVTGDRATYEGITGPDGVAYIDGITVSLDAVYQITVRYSEAPFRSTLFRLHESMGALAELRVFPTTSDPSRVRSATQLEIAGRENNLAQVTQLYQVFVSGDEAFWPGQPLRIEGGEEAIGFVVMDRASPIVEHSEKAPFATLGQPIPPGEAVDLSFAYLVEHEGTAKIRWTPSLPLFEAGAIVARELSLVGATGPATPPPHAPDVPFDYYPLGAREVGVPLELEVSGLPTRPRIYRDLGVGIGLALLALFGLAMGLGPRRGLRERLALRREELVAALEKERAEDRRQALARELDRVIRQLEALDPGKAAAKTPAPGAGEA